MCRAAADNAYGVIRPTVRSTAPTSASARPAPSIKPWRRANNRIAVIRRFGRPLPGFWAACTSRRQIGINRWRKSPLRHFSAIDFPQTPGMPPSP
ncbi:hypothetical protein DDK19_01280 [Pseudomonas aeruginosa]|nr:hypothetical protein DDK19_01280 [Pseudomonas aeruginosa]